MNTMNLVEEQTKAGVVRRIRDWKARLEALYDEIESWIGDSAIEVERFAIAHGDEDPAKKFNVKFGKVPALTLRKGKHHISFIPSVLFIIGADGRVNISTDKEQYNIFDMRDSTELASDWRIDGLTLREGFRKFDRAAFQRIVERTL